MKLVNGTRLKAMAFRQLDAEGALDGVVAARGSFLHRQGDAAAWSPEQEAFRWTDAYEGDPQTTPLLRQTDLTPDKTGTDVTFLGSAFAPDGPTTSWSCGIELGPVAKRLRVSGPRAWVRGRARGLPWRRGPAPWVLGEPEPAGDVPIDWRLAAGGPAGDPAPDPRNPIGCGSASPPPEAPPQGETAALGPWRIAPQILPEEEDASEPAGLGPIAPFWRGRQRHAGTYDEAWREERHPLLPRDFDPRFWQCAPEDQVARPFLAGDEAYRLTNLHPRHVVAEGRLPGRRFAVHVAIPNEAGEGAEHQGRPGTWRLLDLDGVQFDWRQEDLILLTWRARFPLPRAEGVTLHLEWVRLAEADEAPPREEAA